MNAQEARELTSQTQKHNVDLVYLRIKSLIKACAMDGGNSAYFTELNRLTVEDVLKIEERLKSEGYAVFTNGGRYVNIRW